jgi:putative pyoverdin transport system ATP-binding/permease protein
MKLIRYLMRKSKLTVALVALTGVVAGISNVGIMAIINAALNNVSSSQWGLIGGFIALSILTLGCRVASNSLLARLAQGAIVDMRVRLSRQALEVPLASLEKLGAGRIVSMLNDDISAVAFALISLPPFLIHTATLIGCLVYLGYLSLDLLLRLLVFVVIGVLSYQWMMKKAWAHISRARERAGALQSHILAMTQGTKELKMHRRRRREFLSKKIEADSMAFRRHAITGDTLHAAAGGWGQLLIFIFIGLVLFAIRIGDTYIMVSFALISIFITTPVESILNTISTLGRGNIGLKKIEELGLNLVETNEGNTAVQRDAGPLLQGVKLAGITHSFTRHEGEPDFTVGPIDLELRPGELVFLTGGNGSGKTTLAKLLMGLYLPASGDVYVDGGLVTNEDRDNYRQLFSVVFSDFFLFDSLLGLDEPELDAKAQKLLVQLHLDNKVCVKDGALSTTDLSQGQRKRLALLTAYLEERPIYIFDEWAADQDPVFKKTFYYYLLPELKARGKAVLVITHDDHYYEVADRVIKMNNGRIEEVWSDSPSDGVLSVSAPVSH